tara:strand:- start:13847 stop:15103 length:1257 start_codon:yes stop_codon:yes gene_type:complete
MKQENKKIITGIDVGTTKIAVIVAEVKNEEITILGQGITPSFGLNRGEVVDIPKTQQSLQKAILQAEEKANCKIDSAFIGITGEHIRGMSYYGIIPVTQSDGTGSEIQEDHIVKVREKVKDFPISADREILHVLDQEYKVDDQTQIENPKGLHGNRLELNAHIVTIAKNAVHNLKNCLSRDIYINGFVLEPLASAYAVLNNQQRNLGTVLIDIGGGTTDIIIYENNGVKYSSAIPMGGNIITNDIALGIQEYIGECLENDELETLKHDYGSAKKECIDENKEITLNIDGRKIVLRQYQLADIIQSRMTEIFKEIKKHINDTDISNRPYGIVITGGGSQLEHLEELAKETFQQNIIIGFPRNINGPDEIIKNPRFSTAIGLIKYGIESLEVEDITGRITLKTILKDLFRNLKKIFNTWY